MLELDEERALWFRARRSHLAGTGAVSLRAAARDVLGAQSQQLGPSLLALSLRTRGRPDARRASRALFGARRSLVRTWGQRDTIHVYDPADWPAIAALRAEWPMGARRGGMPPERLVDAAGEVLRAAGGPLVRGDLYHLLPRSFVREWEDRLGTRDAALRFAAGRVFWRLNLRGEACVGEKQGAEQGYVAREHWFPDLPWPADRDPLETGRGLARRYLALHAPADARDAAHFFGVRVTDARTWLESLEEEGELVPVACAGRGSLYALAKDARALTEKPPRAKRDWPLRLLPMWDTLLMAHADKSWTVPEEEDRPHVWRKSAVVAATVVDRGRLVATWSHAEENGVLAVEIEPLSRWSPRAHAAAVEREARAVAAHLGLEGARILTSS